MILLDTNVLSAMMQVAPDETVARWLDQQPRESIWITTITVMEIRAGLQAMPISRKRSALANALAVLLSEKIQGPYCRVRYVRCRGGREVNGAAKAERASCGFQGHHDCGDRSGLPRDAGNTQHFPFFRPNRTHRQSVAVTPPRLRVILRFAALRSDGSRGTPWPESEVMDICWEDLN